MVSKRDCTGCAACVAVCSRKAMRMEQAADGFFYPVIDAQLCVDCGRCRSVCPVISRDNGDTGYIKACAVKHTDEVIRARSSSGGAFSALAGQVLGCGGVVFGAALNDELRLCHICVETIEGLACLRGSKYLQSDVQQAYCGVKEYLDVDRPVLFSGTPCQVAGLRAFLGKEYPNLLTVDFICHGVPSPVMWDSYLSYRQKQSGDRVVGASFRDKCTGWKKFSMRLDYSRGESCAQDLSRDLYLKGFLSNLFLRRSCYRCSFKGGGGGSDITLADGWGIERIAPELNDDKGLSLVLVNTPAGERWLEQAAQMLEMLSVPAHQMLSSNRSYYESAEYSLLQFFAVRDCSRLDFDKLIKKYCQLTKPKRAARYFGRKAAKLLKL